MALVMTTLLGLLVLSCRGCVAGLVADTGLLRSFLKCLANFFNWSSLLVSTLPSLSVIGLSAGGSLTCELPSGNGLVPHDVLPCYSLARLSCWLSLLMFIFISLFASACLVPLLN